MKTEPPASMMEQARSKYFMRDFRNFMRKAHGFTDEDFVRAAPIIRDMVLASKEPDPREMFDRILRDFAPMWTKPAFPTNADWHHFLVPGTVLCALRNCGYAIKDDEIVEGMGRGESLLGGSCGFAGSCGGAYSVGIILSMVRKTNPIHETERSEIMRAVAETLRAIADHPRRCCKRSSYIAIREAVRHLHALGYDRLNAVDRECAWHSQNKTCFGVQCPFYPRRKSFPGDGDVS